VLGRASVRGAFRRVCKLLTPETLTRPLKTPCGSRAGSLPAAASGCAYPTLVLRYKSLRIFQRPVPVPIW
jgi:hypothetical protein